MGADMPVTLRPKGLKQSDHDSRVTKPTLEFRGESYVHGMMDGEALIKARSQKDDDDGIAADRSWLDQLGAGPWPFDIEMVVLE